MAVNAEKIKLGPCKVTFDPDGEPVVLETTIGGVTVTYEQTTREVTVDQYGNTPVKELVVQHNAQAVVPFGEYDLDKLTKLIPGSEIVTDQSDPTKKRVDVKAKVFDLIKHAKKVIIEPLDPEATPNDTIILYKAAPRPQLNYTYSNDNELITNVTFKGYPDKDNDNKIIGFGDDTI